MINDQERTVLATAAQAALCLRTLIRSELHYPSTLGRPEVRALADAIRVEMHIALSLPPFSFTDAQRGELAKHDDPEFESTAVLVSTLGWLQQLEGIAPVAADASIAALSEHSTPQLRKLRLQLEEILIFDCRTPVFIKGDDGFEGRRAFLMLRKYWEAYRDLLVQHGSHVGVISPHPMTRLIENLRDRIRACLAKLAQPQLIEALDPLLELEFDLDTAEVFEPYVLPRIATAEKRLESAAAAYGSGPLDLTAAEGLFLEAVELASRQVSTQLDEYRKRMLGPGTHRRSAESLKSPSCFESIRAVEQQFRGLIRDVFESHHRERWVEAIKKALASPAAEAAVRTMGQRGIRDEVEILHYLQLSDLFDLVRGNWSMFAPRTKLRRREFNDLAAAILKGRTEEAHNRPEHLWSEIESQRVRVACHDLRTAFALG